MAYVQMVWVPGPSPNDPLKPWFGPAAGNAAPTSGRASAAPTCPAYRPLAYTWTSTGRPRTPRSSAPPALATPGPRAVADSKLPVGPKAALWAGYLVHALVG